MCSSLCFQVAAEMSGTLARFGWLCAKSLMLSQPNLQHTPPLQLQHLVKRHLDLAKSRFGDSWRVPKCHLAGHLALQFQKHQVPLSCFVQERKHKIIKRISNEISDTSKAFERSMIQDAHLESLEEGVYLPGQGVRLVEPVKPAPARLQTEIHNTLQVHGEVLTARQAVHGGNFTVAAGDLALMDLDGATAVGKVAYHVMSEKTVWSHVTFWTHVHGCMYAVSADDCGLVQTRLIRATCLYSVSGNNAIVAVPQL